MEQDFIEAILLWNKDANPDAVVAWLRSDGLNSVPMSSGLLVTGSRTAFEKAFDADLTETSKGLSLPVPKAIRSHVASIQIPRAREIHKPRT